MRQGITQFAPFVNRAGGLGGDVAGNAAGKGELLEQVFQAERVLRNVGIDFAVGPFEIGVGHQARPAVPRADHVDHVQIVLEGDQAG